MKKLSIVIPVYNTSIEKLDRLFKTLECNKENVEIIVVDDHSYLKDTIDFLKNLAVQKKIKLIKNKRNIGLGPSRNIGFENSEGKFVWFIDSDDYLNKNWEEIIFNVLKKDVDFISINSKSVYKRKIVSNENTFLYKNDKIFYMSTVWSKIFKRNFLEKNKIKHLNKRWAHEDEYFTLKVLNNYNKMSFIEEVIYYYDRTENKSITKLTSKTKSFSDTSKYLSWFLKEVDYISDINKKYMRKYLLFYLANFISFNINRKKIKEYKYIYNKIYSICFCGESNKFLIIKIIKKILLKRKGNEC